MYAALVNAPSVEEGACHPGVLVAPGKPDQSYLVHKITGLGMCPGTQRMPFGGELTDAQIQTLVDWICVGAPNN
jgi:hypothetical protein